MLTLIPSGWNDQTLFELIHILNVLSHRRVSSRSARGMFPGSYHTRFYISNSQRSGKSVEKFYAVNYDTAFHTALNALRHGTVIVLFGAEFSCPDLPRRILDVPNLG